MSGHSLNVEPTLAGAAEEVLGAASRRSSADTAGRRRKTRKWLLLVDLFAVLLTTTVVFQGLRFFDIIISDLPHRIGLPLLLVCVSLPVMAGRGLYARLDPPLSHLSKHGLFVAIAVMSIGVAFIPILHVDRVTLLTVGTAAVAFVPIFIGVRQVFIGCVNFYRSRPYSVKYVAIVGCDDFAQAAIERLQDPEYGCFQIAGCFSPLESQSQDSVADVPVLGTVAGLRHYLTQHAIDTVVFATPAGALSATGQLIDSVLELGVSVAMPQSETIATSAHEVRRSEAFSGLPMTLIETVVQPPAYLFTKRLLDIVLSFLGLVAISPLLLVVALLVKITSPDGPIFYPWRVLGKNRRPFVGYKFRTMVANADELKKQMAHQNEMKGPVFKVRNDPRITPLGRWLRKFSIDELPQLYSVLKGDMSLVGPRPAAKNETDHYEFWQHRKLSVKPGITCLWQVSGRSEISDFVQWVKLDLEYIRTASLAVDIKILLRTIPVVLFGRGAY